MYRPTFYCSQGLTYQSALPIYKITNNPMIQFPRGLIEFTSETNALTGLFY